MNPITARKYWLFASDVDDTLLGDDEALAKLKNALEAMRERLIIVLNSSRPCTSIRKSLEEYPNLPRPDYLIGALGTEIEGRLPAHAVNRYVRRLADGWQRDKIAEMMGKLGFAAHPMEYQTPLKASYYVPGDAAYRRVREELYKSGMKARLIFSGNKNLDIIPLGADKGKAVEFLREGLGFDGERVVVAGDSANDGDMFTYTFKGIVVANSDPTMKAVSAPHIYHARACNAAGVLEGLHHWGVLRQLF